MSTNKYASLPDIDTAPDVYETEDTVPSSHDDKDESSDDETGIGTRSHVRSKNGEQAGREELDMSNLSAEQASRKFKHAEKPQHRPRILYVYPPSPTSDASSTLTTDSTPVLSLSQRLRRIQAEISALEVELSDPSNPLLQKEREAGHDPGELIKGMVDVKSRLGKISKVKEGRGRLVGVLMGDDAQPAELEKAVEGHATVKGKPLHPDGHDITTGDDRKALDAKDVAEMDRRLGELEKVVGSSSTALDELTPMPPPLLPLLTRLNAQLMLLTQPRHIDSTSRRLKLLLSDLERLSSANAHPHSSQRRQSSHHPSGPISPHPNSASGSATTPVPLLDQLAPILTRLAPQLPHIPHLLTRLRTVSELHTSAASFESTLEGLEETQRRQRSDLTELSRALEGVENSMKGNEELIKGNVKGMEEAVEDVSRRVEELKVIHD